MGVKRYELSDVQWVRIAPLLSGKASDPGRTGADNRLFVNGVLWVLRSGAHWRDLPERYGKYKSLHKRFSRWAKAGLMAGDEVLSVGTLEGSALTLRAVAALQERGPALAWRIRREGVERVVQVSAAEGFVP